jgi:hypothetical protein
MRYPPTAVLHLLTRRDLLGVAVGGMVAGMPLAHAAAPHGQLTWGVHISLAPTWLDPAETCMALVSGVLPESSDKAG